MKFMMKQHPCSTINVRGSYKKEYICFRYIRCTHVRDRCSAAGGLFRLLRADVDRDKVNTGCTGSNEIFLQHPLSVTAASHTPPSAGAGGPPAHHPRSREEPATASCRPGWEGVFILASVPSPSTSCICTITQSAGLPQRAAIIPQFSSFPFSSRRYSLARATSSGSAVSSQPWGPCHYHGYPRKPHSFADNCGADRPFRLRPSGQTRTAAASSREKPVSSRSRANRRGDKSQILRNDLLSPPPLPPAAGRTPGRGPAPSFRRWRPPPRRGWHNRIQIPGNGRCGECHKTGTEGDALDPPPVSVPPPSFPSQTADCPTAGLWRKIRQGDSPPPSGARSSSSI